MVERDVQQIKHDALWGVLKDSHPCELHVHIQTCLQLVQHGHGITHVLENKETNSASGFCYKLCDNNAAKGWNNVNKA